MKKTGVFLFVGLLFLVACHKVPITNRKQVKLLPNSTLNTMALDGYKDFLSKNTLSTNAEQTAMVKRAGDRISKAAERYFKAKGHAKYLANYKWEFNLVEDKNVNAWCMPGGKVVVYTGIMPVCKDEDGLAVVMGHEIAHAIANHGNERMSQGLAAQMGGLALSTAMASKPQATQNLFMQAYGAGAQVGALLPFSRLHESEADEIGLVLSTMAGYDPEAAVPFWGRMNALSNGQRPPEFLSTHPSPKTRMEKLKAVVPKAKLYAKKYGTAK